MMPSCKSAIKIDNYSTIYKNMFILHSCIHSFHSPQVPSCWLSSESKYRAWGWFSCMEVQTEWR